MQTALAASQRVFNLLDEPVEKPVSNPQNVEIMEGNVSLKMYTLAMTLKYH